MLKKILLVVTVLITIGVCTGIYMWNKPQPKAEDKKGIATTAEQITKDYAANEQNANVQYLDKVVELSGTVSEVSKNQDGAVIAMLETGDPLSGVQCTMRERNVTVAKGQHIVVKGFCRGNNMGVVVTDCIVN